MPLKIKFEQILASNKAAVVKFKKFLFSVMTAISTKSSDLSDALSQVSLY